MWSPISRHNHLEGKGGNPLTKHCWFSSDLNFKHFCRETGGEKDWKLTFVSDSYCERIHGYGSKPYCTYLDFHILKLSKLVFFAIFINHHGPKWLMDLTHPTKIISWEYHSNYDPNFTAYSSTTINQVITGFVAIWLKQECLKPATSQV